MTTKRVSMQKIKDILRLKYDAKLPLRQIALSLNLSLGAVSKYLDFVEMQRELKHKGMTRQLLWEEYAQAHPEAH